MARLRDWVIDYSYVLKGVVVLRRKPPLHYTEENQAGKVPIILLSGLSFKWYFLRYIGNQLSLDGHPVYIIPNLQRNFISVPQSASLVRKVVELHNLRQVIIIGFSKGGLIGKYILMHHNNDNRIKTVIAISTPFHGTRLARIVPRPAFREVMPDSPVIKELQANTKVNKHIISIIPEFDNHVWAVKGSNLDGARNINVKVRGHHRIVFDKAVQAMIVKMAREET